MTKYRIPVPTIINEVGEGKVFTLEVTDELCYFPGHFPAHRILPGVAIIDWVMDLGQRYMGLVAATPLQLESIKFKRIVESPSTVMLEIKHRSAKGKMSFSLTSGVGEHSSGRILLAAPSQSEARDV